PVRRGARHSRLHRPDAGAGPHRLPLTLSTSSLTESIPTTCHHSPSKDPQCPRPAHRPPPPKQALPERPPASQPSSSSASILAPTSPAFLPGRPNRPISR